MDDLLARLGAGEPVFWRNPECECGEYPADFTLKDMLDAEARLARFAPLLAQLFDEAAEQFGIIESRLLDVPKLADRLCPGARILLKADHDLPVAGSVKARGGIYNVLCFAESLCLKNGLLQPGENYRKMAEPAVRSLFGRYTVSVGSTGNLGLSIGTIAAALGFRARVHMSADAKEWKKQLLRSRGVEVIEYGGDYSTAVAQGRREAEQDPYSYFVDDENSPELFLGYAVAAFRLRDQLRLRGIVPAPDRPLFVINYASCHDNYTLYDQLIQTMKENRVADAYTQAEALVFFSEGVPFIQEGEDFMRSKYNETTGKYDGNSYISGDYVNEMDYSLKIKNLDTFEKVKELIAVRKSESALRLSSRSEISEKLKDVSFAGGVISFSVDDVIVVHTVSATTFKLEGTYEIIYSNTRDTYGTVSSEVSLSTNESILLKKVS